MHPEVVMDQEVLMVVPEVQEVRPKVQEAQEVQVPEVQVPEVPLVCAILNLSSELHYTNQAQQGRLALLECAPKRHRSL